MLRRDVLKQIGLGVFVAAATTKKQSLTAFINGDSRTDAPWWLLHPLQKGSSVGKGWRISGLSPVEKGACVLTLEKTSLFQSEKDNENVTSIHICAKGNEQRGIASSALLDLILMDGRSGEEPTQEDLGRVVLGLAHRIQKNEMQLQADLSGLASLQSHEERVYRYGPENLI